MELQAAISGLEFLEPDSKVQVHVTTDSEYLLKGITDWVPRWKRRGWLTGEGRPVKNKDLWVKLEALTKLHEINWTWTRGHADHADNNRVDGVAREMAEYAKKTRN